MAYLFGDSFDFYSTVSDMSGRWTSLSIYNSGPTLVSGTNTAFNAGQALSCAIASFPGIYYPLALQTGSNDTTIYGSIRLKWNSPASSSNSSMFLTFQDGSNSQCTIAWKGDGSISLYSGSITGTLITNIAANFPINQWLSFQFKVVIDPTVGSVQMRQNGSIAYSVNTSGINTRAGSTNSYSNTVILGFNFNSSCFFTVDDFILCNSSGSTMNTWLGDLRAIQQSPATSIQSQFTIGGTSIGAANWNQVADKIEDGDTSYVYSSTVGNEDIYGMSSIATSYNVVGVNYLAYLKKSDSGPRTVALSLNANSSGDVVQTSISNFGESYAYYSTFSTTDPTGAAWTPITINNAQVGIKITA